MRLRSGRLTISPRRLAVRKRAAPWSDRAALFSAPLIGMYGTPFNSDANHVAGGVVGYQKEFDNTRRSLVFEVGGRKDTNDVKQGQIGAAARYQQACGQHTILLFDVFLDKQEGLDVGGGVRTAVIWKF